MKEASISCVGGGLKLGFLHDTVKYKSFLVNMGFLHYHQSLPMIKPIRSHQIP